jgi:GTP cyclohydrolase I
MQNPEPGKKTKKINRLNKKRIEKLIRQLLIEIGENPNREGLADTPRRISDMY